MTLAEAQALLHEAITSPEPLPAARLEACFAGTAELSAPARVAIYAGMYRSRLVDALRQTFPCLARHLGDESFAALAEDYLRRHPSEHHDIGQVGRRLADFLRRYPDPERPDLADLADLEWTRQEVFFAETPAPVGPEALAGLEAEAFVEARLELAPALRVLALGHAVAPLWRSLDAGERPGPPLAGEAAVAVWRRGFDVVHGALELDEARAVALARAGRCLAEVCECFAGREAPAEAAHRALASWLAEGWITAVVTAPPRGPGGGDQDRPRGASRRRA